MKYLARIIAAAVASLYLAAIACNASGAEAKNIHCKDGDTFTADIHLGFDIVLVDQDIRVFGYDAWETSYRRQTVRVTPEEIIKGQLAKAALEKLLGGSRKVEVVEVKNRDPYGRRLVKVYADGQEIGSILRAQGHERHE